MREKVWSGELSDQDGDTVAAKQNSMSKLLLV